jgi:amino acid transporter
MIPAALYVRRETTISIVINVALSLLFFLLVFGRTDPVPVWGLGKYAFDFIPQSFMIALMSTIVPGILAIRRRRARLVDRVEAPSRLPRKLVPRALLVALLAVLLGAGLVSLVLAAAQIDMIAWTPALVVKLIYGGALAAIVTPPTLRAALHQP